MLLLLVTWCCLFVVDLWFDWCCGALVSWGVLVCVLVAFCGQGWCWIWCSCVVSLRWQGLLFNVVLVVGCFAVSCLIVLVYA